MIRKRHKETLSDQYRREQRRDLWAYLTRNQHAIPRHKTIISDLFYQSRHCLQRDLHFLRRNGYITWDPMCRGTIRVLVPLV